MSNIGSIVNSPAASTSESAANAAAAKKKESMGKDQFLMLLTTQLRYQDPSKPMDDTAFVAQLAQFSSLEQMQNVSSAMDRQQAGNMIGSTITYTDADGAEQTGIVTAMKITSGQVQVMIGDTAVDLTKVTGVKQPANAVTQQQLAGMNADMLVLLANAMIGKTVTWKNGDTQQQGVVSSTSISNGIPKLTIGGQTVDMSTVVSIQNT